MLVPKAASQGESLSSFIKLEPSILYVELGNILLSIDNISLNSMVELRKYLYTKKPGDVVTIKFADSLGTRYTEQIILDKKK